MCEPRPNFLRSSMMAVGMSSSFSRTYSGIGSPCLKLQSNRQQTFECVNEIISYLCFNPLRVENRTSASVDTDSDEPSGKSSSSVPSGN